MSQITNISNTVRTGRADFIVKLINEGLEAKIPAADFLNDEPPDGMMKLGFKFKNNEVYVPEVFIAARALIKGIETLNPYFIDGGVTSVEKMVLATVKGLSRHR